MGIGRTHQVPRPFTDMTVFENAYVGATAGGGLRGRAAYDRCLSVLQTSGLLSVANRRAASLGLLDRKRLELARALAAGPEVLLLDEIGGGLTDAEAEELLETVERLRASGITIVWIEHIVHILARAVRPTRMHGRRQGDRRRHARRGATGRAGHRRLPGPSSVSVLEVNALVARHGALTAVREVTFAVEEGSTLALVGANGAGKTTLLRTIAGAHPATSGRSDSTASTSPTFRRTVA